jgi:hypothetical protein
MGRQQLRDYFETLFNLVSVIERKTHDYDKNNLNLMRDRKSIFVVGHRKTPSQVTGQ